MQLSLLEKLQVEDDVFIAVAGSFDLWLHVPWASEAKTEGLQSWIREVSEAVGIVHQGCCVERD